MKSSHLGSWSASEGKRNCCFFLRSLIMLPPRELNESCLSITNVGHRDPCQLLNTRTKVLAWRREEEKGQTEKGGGREQWNCERPANLFSKCELHLRGAQGPLCFYGGEDRIDSNTPLTVRLYEFTKPYTCITSTKVRLKKDLLPLNNWSCEYTQQHTAFQFKWKRKIWY